MRKRTNTLTVGERPTISLQKGVAPSLKETTQ